jgi:hypothetical protein
MNHELRTTRERWGYDPNFVRCDTADDQGNLLKVWFEPVASRQISGFGKRVSSTGRLMSLLTVFAGLAALTAFQFVQQAVLAG